jgi:two-component system chemotaxis sensor kinase CheA
VSTDLKQFYQVFFEEAAELLAEMETLLLGLDVSSPNPEHLNAIFRVAHSIKGGAGTFGFSDMTELTHVLESLLDKLRKGELEVQIEMIDVFLKAGDVLKGQLAGHRGDGEADAAAAAEVGAKLKQLAAGVGAPAKPAAATAAEPVAAAPAVTPNVFRIEFSCEGVNARVMENLLADLAGRGALENLSPPVTAAGGKTKKQAGKKAGKQADRKTGKQAIQHCVFRLTTASSEEDIWEALAFVVDPANLKIETEASSAGNLGASPSGDPDKTQAGDLQQDRGYGFFQEAPAAPAAAQASSVDANAGVAGVAAELTRSPGRRASDNPELAVAKAGRRDNDKLAVAAAGETSSIRVSVEKVDQLINLVGELVITQAMLDQTASQVDPVIFEKLLNGMSQLERNTRDLQESVMSIRMMPISFVFSRYPRVVRDLAAKLNKQVELKTVGEGTELDKGLIEKIADPLTHLVRNSLDHGIELPEQRVAAGKPAIGTITLRAFHQGGSIVIEVGDDGAGLNREKILAKAKERGMAVHDGMPDQEVWQLIFEAGFSTAAVVTDVSGRGVGMDVVKRNIQGMGGRVEIDSALGVGTRISIRLPLTLAILDGLSVSVGGELFIVPLTYIVESLQPAAADVKTVSGRGRVVHVRGEYLPLVALHEVFNIRPEVTEAHKGIIVILEAEGCKTAMFVDALVGQHQVVIKSLESNYRRVQGVSGATIMGDGRVALILDPEAIAREAQGALADAA